MVFDSQPRGMDDEHFRTEHKYLKETFHGWFGLEAKSMLGGMHEKTLPISCYSTPGKRGNQSLFFTSVFFALPQVAKDRIVLGGFTFDPHFMKDTFFPQV